MSGYIVSKAERLLKVGAEIYRKSDALGQPEATLPTSSIDQILNAAQQLVDGRGLIEERPFLGLGVEGFYDLIKTFHFEVCKQETIPTTATDKILDRMTCRHIVTNQEAVLFNLVDAPKTELKVLATGRHP